jgi:hypothetical protein
MMGRKTKPQEEKKTKLSLSISTDNYTQLMGSKINKSQLINWLLDQHFNSLGNEK